MLSVDAKGVFPIAPTPFLADGTIDAASVDRMIDHYVAAGADGCTILGIMGEAPKLDHDEAIDFVACCIARAPKLPFIVGVSAPGFAAMRALSHTAMAAHRRSDRNLLRAGGRGDRVGHSLRHSRLSVDAQRDHDAERHPRII